MVLAPLHLEDLINYLMRQEHGNPSYVVGRTAAGDNLWYSQRMVTAKLDHQLHLGIIYRVLCKHFIH